ncbi:uncharacterized protein B0H18DRAFT_1012091 [Fomitopsis serialis]|uniref:uncharacterized protein n=1 Tax=Fomitopsis serialis TaxID=139415 RepID=UPI00200748FA|nr:uncharacterized protein B0H18DRAFT_1012091 [Neoantrodia serialis]KAH9924417.1 hypothetical protein B0H18DRAFT_1012091 [Neoantrodia serialis]
MLWMMPMAFYWKLSEWPRAGAMFRKCDPPPDMNDLEICRKADIIEEKTQCCQGAVCNVKRLCSCLECLDLYAADGRCSGRMIASHGGCSVDDDRIRQCHCTLGRNAYITKMGCHCPAYSYSSGLRGTSDP